MAISFSDRHLFAAIKARRLDARGLAALRRAVSFLGLAIGRRIAELRDSDDRFLVVAS